MSVSPPDAARLAGRYELLHEIATGGMATVHLARLAGPGGFSHTFAVKRLHAQFARSPEFVAMFLDEARLAAHVRHANVVRVFEVFLERGELFLVLEYVEGPSLDRLASACARRGEVLPQDVALGVVHGALMGLHAAHEAKDDAQRPLRIVHRDVSPHNVLVGVDGIARLLDFGIAKAESRLGSTREGQIKGKFAYMAPEQVQGEEVDRRTDVFAMGIVLWELLAGRRLYEAPSEGASMMRILQVDAPPPSAHAPGVDRALDEVVLRALARDRDARFPDARAFARALEAAARLATPSEVATFLERFGPDELGRARVTPARADEGTADHVAPATFAAPVPTQVTHVTHVAPDAAPSRSGRAVPWLLAAAAVGAVAGFAVWAQRPGAMASNPGDAPLGGGPTPGPSEARSVEGGLAVDRSTPAVDLAPSALTTAAAVTAIPSASAAPIAPNAAGPSHWRPAAKVSCNPPFDVLPSGIKRYKRECVR